LVLSLAVILHDYEIEPRVRVACDIAPPRLYLQAKPQLREEDAMSEVGRLAGKVALVTGAGSGIGEATARAFARHGATVIVNDVRAEAGEAVARDVGDRAEFLHFDASNAEAWEGAIATLIERHGGIDILVNNAGTGTGGGIERETLAEHRRVMDLNVTGVWLGIRSAIPAMERRGGGSIVNISSIDGLVGVEGLSTYVASKFAVTGMTRSLALELGGRGIRVNSVHPGIIETPMVAKNTGKSMARLQAAVARQPIARMGRPDEIANAIVFFASDESSFCTGASLVVDGGHIAGPHREPM
jgi:3alpha(or 20beta)-hydroxysteroid dehydrogenase